MAGPLSGIKVIELLGLGPAPYTCMLLADAGADILCLERPDPSADPTKPYHRIEKRSRPSVGIDLKHPDGIALVRDLVREADAFIEAFRPGVAERLGLGPEELLEVNPALVYGRMTGWGQEGSLAARAGHDINYISIAGALWGMGRADEVPSPPLNLVGDYGAGGMMLAFGITAALLEAKASGRGQVVDAAMVDGVASMMHLTYGMHFAGVWSEDRGSNLLDSGAHFYDVYETKDGGFMSVGAIEPQFYAELIELLGLSGETLAHQNDKRSWPAMKERFKEIFLTQTRGEWTSIFEGKDACVFPLLTTWEAPTHPYLVERGVFVEPEGVVQAAPVPRFSRTPAEISSPPSVPGADTVEALEAWGVERSRIDALLGDGALFS
jgi:alpha-methylacyl-CoA racemase